MKNKQIQLQTKNIRVFGWYLERKNAERVQKALKEDGFVVFLTTSDDYAEFPFKVVFKIDKVHTRRRAIRTVIPDRRPVTVNSMTIVA